MSKLIMSKLMKDKARATGATKEQDVYDAVHKLRANLEEQNVIFYE